MRIGDFCTPSPKPPFVQRAASASEERELTDAVSLIDVRMREIAPNTLTPDRCFPDVKQEGTAVAWKLCRLVTRTL